MRRVRNLLRNPGWKAAAVVLAYFFWLGSAEDRQAIRQLDVPVRFEQLNPTLALVRDRPTTLIVRLQGAEQVVKALEPLDVEAHVDLSGLGVGTHLVRFSPDSPTIVVKRPGLRVSEVYPPALEVRLEPKLTTVVPVTATINGTPAAGFEVSEQRIEPGRVRIEGPESAVLATTAARTRDISIAGRRISLEIQTPVDVADPAIEIVGDARVRVFVTIAEIVVEKSFTEIPVAPLGSSFETRIRPTSVRVTVRGPQAVLAELSREDVVAYVDLKNLAPQAQDYELPVRCVFTKDILRERATVAAVSHERVAVQVSSRRLSPPAGSSDGG